MSYRLWFRLMIKGAGLLIIAQALPYLVQLAAALVDDLVSLGLARTLTRFDASNMLRHVTQSGVLIVIGVYLLFGGKWILNKCAPLGRFCPECGYDVSHGRSANCPECGTPLPNRAPDHQ